MIRIVLAILAVAILPDAALAQRSENTRRKVGLTHEQLHALQQALKDDGCYDGRVDGVMGGKTRAGIACARRKHDLEGDNANDLFRALNLDFTIADSTGMGGIMRTGNRPPERRRNRTLQDTSSPRNRDAKTRGDTIGMENKGKGQREKVKPPGKP